MLAQDIWPGPLSARPSRFTLARDLVFFTADDGAHGQELWAVPLGALGIKPHTIFLPLSVAAQGAPR